MFTLIWKLFYQQPQSHVNLQSKALQYACTCKPVAHFSYSHQAPQQICIQEYHMHDLKKQLNNIITLHSHVLVITWLYSCPPRFQSRPTIWPFITIESPVAQWLHNPSRSLRVVVSNPIWDSHIFQLFISPYISYHCCWCFFNIHHIQLKIPTHPLTGESQNISILPRQME